MLGYLLNHVIELSNEKVASLMEMSKEYPEFLQIQDTAKDKFGLTKLEPLFGGSATELMVDWIIDPTLTMVLKDTMGEIYFVTHGNPDGSFTFSSWEHLAEIANSFAIKKVNLISCYNGMRTNKVVNGVEFIIPEATNVAAPCMMLPKSFEINSSEEFCFFSDEAFNSERFMKLVQNRAWIRDTLIEARRLGR